MAHFFYLQSEDDIISLIAVATSIQGSIGVVGRNQNSVRKVVSSCVSFGCTGPFVAKPGEVAAGDQIWVHSLVTHSLSDEFGKSVKTNFLVYFYDCVLWDAPIYEHADSVFVISEACAFFSLESLKHNLGYPEHVIEEVRAKFVVAGRFHFSGFSAPLIERLETLRPADVPDNSYSLVVTRHFKDSYAKIAFEKSALGFAYRCFRNKQFKPHYLKYLFDPSVKATSEAMSDALRMRADRVVIRSRKKDASQIVHGLHRYCEGADLIVGPSVSFESDNAQYLIKHARSVLNFGSFSVLEAALFERPCVSILEPFQEFNRIRLDPKFIFANELRGMRLGSLSNFPGVNSCFLHRDFVSLAKSNPEELWVPIAPLAVKRYLELYFPPSTLHSFA